MKKTRVLIVDDSAVVREVLTKILKTDKSIEVVGTAPDPFIARDKIVKLKPDIITLDVEMPRMDGITFLEKLMVSHPMPVIIVSSLTQKGTQTALNALEAGALEVIAKPELDLKKGLNEIGPRIISKIKGLSKAKVQKREKKSSKKEVIKTSRALVKSTNKVIAIGASTGGTEAIKVVLRGLPANSPGIVIVQHMPAKFTTAFSERLNKVCQVEVKEAKEGDSVIPGRALLAPGGYHMELKRSGARYYVSLNQEEPVHYNRPSVDVLFKSVATYAGSNTIGVILTGMGRDGKDGMVELKRAGSRTIAQDEKTCVVFGMPKEAIKKGAIEKILPISKISEQILKFCQ